MSACCFTSVSLMQFVGSSAHEGPVPEVPAVQRNRSQVIQPMGGVRASPLSRPWPRSASRDSASSSSGRSGHSGAMMGWR